MRSGGGERQLAKVREEFSRSELLRDRDFHRSFQVLFHNIDVDRLRALENALYYRSGIHVDRLRSVAPEIHRAVPKNLKRWPPLEGALTELHDAPGRRVCRRPQPSDSTAMSGRPRLASANEDRFKVVDVGTLGLRDSDPARRIALDLVHVDELGAIESLLQAGSRRLRGRHVG